jgi:hypothetical protein
VVALPPLGKPKVMQPAAMTDLDHDLDMLSSGIQKKPEENPTPRLTNLDDVLKSPELSPIRDKRRDMQVIDDLIADLDI